MQVVAWSFLREDLRHGGMNEKGHKRSKEPWNVSHISWKGFKNMHLRWPWGNIGEGGT